MYLFSSVCKDMFVIWLEVWREGGGWGRWGRRGDGGGGEGEREGEEEKGEEGKRKRKEIEKTEEEESEKMRMEGGLGSEKKRVKREERLGKKEMREWE